MLLVRSKVLILSIRLRGLNQLRKQMMPVLHGCLPEVPSEIRRVASGKRPGGRAA